MTRMVGVAMSSFNGTMSLKDFETKYKQCTQCKHWKVKAAEFSPHNSRPCGYQSACKSCRSKNAAAARLAKKEIAALKTLANQVVRGKL